MSPSPRSRLISVIRLSCVGTKFDAKSAGGDNGHIYMWRECQCIRSVSVLSGGVRCIRVGFRLLNSFVMCPICFPLCVIRQVHRGELYVAGGKATILIMDLASVSVKYSVSLSATAGASGVGTVKGVPTSGNNSRRNSISGPRPGTGTAFGPTVKDSTRSGSRGHIRSQTGVAVAETRDRGLRQ